MHHVANSDSLGMSSELPNGFVDLSEVIPELRYELAYAGSQNFVGSPIDGYRHGRRCIATSATATALRKVQEELLAQGLTIFIFDAYRPQRAVEHFLRWQGQPDDVKTKATYYPAVEKSALFELGYLAKRSAHSRGSTLDLTLCELAGSAHPLDMGTLFDFFGPESWPAFEGISPAQRANRDKLRSQMLKHGFLPHPMEWWHFTLRGEPFPDHYFDFCID